MYTQISQLVARVLRTYATRSGRHGTLIEVTLYRGAVGAKYVCPFYGYWCDTVLPDDSIVVSYCLYSALVD